MFTLKELNWDTAYFNLKSAKVELNNELDDRSKEQLFTYLSNREFVTIVNYNNKPENNRILSTNSEIYLADINLQFTFTRNIHTTNKFINGSGNYIHKNKFQFNNEIIRIAEKSFEHSRFLKSDILPKRKAQNIYKEWVKNSFEKEDKYFIVYREEEKILGFIIYSIEKNQLTIELLAVSEDNRNADIGTKMIKVLTNEKSNTRINVGTQLNNINAINFYMKNGFRLTSVNSIYHYEGSL